jgi:hypothetical protein
MKLLWVLLAALLIIPGAYAVTHIDDQTLTVDNIIISGLIYKGDVLYTDYLLSVMPPGPQGPQGIQGPAGSQGVQGEAGSTGAKGEAGSQGIQGIQGIQGVAGEAGAQGIQGVQGPIGDTGPDGLKGDPGNQGIPGAPGDDGAPGSQGERGFNGTQGIQGIPGIQGERGFNGTQGIQGAPGNDGADGAAGAKGDTGDTGPQGPVYTPPSLMQLNLAQAIPFTAAPTTMTPTAHAANVAKVFPFEVDRPITVNVVTIRTNAAVANCLIMGIYDSAGNRLWQSGVLSTVATNTVPVTANLPITLPVGTYYFVTVNNNVVSATAAYTVTSAVGAVGFPRWGTVPAVNGAIPASINPAAITETTGGWLAYVQLSNITT